MSTTRTKKPVVRKPTSRKSGPTKPVLPAALAKRAREQHAAKQARLAAIGRAAIARVLERQTDIAASMVDIGAALAELKADGMADALGRESFAELCAIDLRMSTTTANGLIDLATRAPRELVTRLGPDRTRAVLELVDATADDASPEDLLRAPVKLPSGRTINVLESSAVEIREAAKEIRAARPDAGTKRSRGFTTTPAEKKTFAEVTRRFEGHGGAGAAKLVAMRDGKGAKVRFEVRLTELASFADALRKAARG